MPIRILIVDDHPVVRKGLRMVLDRVDGLTVVGEAGDGAAAVAAAKKLRPDVVLMDVALPTISGVEATERIRREMPAVRVLALSGHERVGYADAMRRAGAYGFVRKACPIDELCRAVHAVAAGEEVFDEELGADGGALNCLTQREREVLALLADGKKTRAAALHLGISVKTVESHRRKLMRKLGITSVAGLTKYAVQTGLSSPDP